MKTSNQSCIDSRSATTSQCLQTKKTLTRKISQMERELNQLDQFENALKNRMQDRMKFMSAKNAIQGNQELKNVAHRREALQVQLRVLQESI